MDYIQTGGEFSKRIRNRHTLWWSSSHDEAFKRKEMTRYNPIHEWKKEDLWQAKLSNKFNAREFAIMHNCKTADLYWKGRDADRIDFSALPAHYVIRPTAGHSANNVYIMQNGLNLFDKKRYTPEEIVQLLKTTLEAHPTQEFLIEEFLQSESGEYKILDDYKFFCFNGKIACVHIINRLGPKTGYSAFFDEHWNYMRPFHLLYPPKDGQKKPHCFDEMLEHVKRLSEAYGIFVRIDYYATAKGAVFGEFTPTPGIGKGVNKYGQKLLTQYWDKYCSGMI